ncbi:MAG: hypothetical protein AAFY11_15680, partial [Cyanobacteria bacterium J06641_5]
RSNKPRLGFGKSRRSHFRKYSWSEKACWFWDTVAKFAKLRRRSTLVPGCWQLHETTEYYY